MHWIFLNFKAGILKNYIFYSICCNAYFSSFGSNSIDSFKGLDLGECRNIEVSHINFFEIQHHLWANDESGWDGVYIQLIFDNQTRLHCDLEPYGSIMGTAQISLYFFFDLIRDIFAAFWPTRMYITSLERSESYLFRHKSPRCVMLAQNTPISYHTEYFVETVVGTTINWGMLSNMWANLICH